jgi:polyadenylate-binding protein
MSTQVYQSNTLYVGDLDPSVDETTLFNEFSSVGGVTTVHVCTDRVSGRSLGYAYVNFRAIEDADKALNTLNFKKIKSKEIRLMWSNRNPATRRAPEKNLFVRNLPESVDSKILHNHFSTIGNVYSCKVSTDEHGNSRGYGFVQMERKEDAERAIDELNGQEIAGTAIEVAQYLPPRDRSQNWTNCYFKFLPQAMTHEEATQFFTRIGPVTSLYLPPPRTPTEGAINAGYGFVNFANHELAVQAVEQLNGHQFEEVKEGEEATTPGLIVQRQLAKRELSERKKLRREERRRAMNQRYANRNLYVRNIPLNYNEDMLRNLFGAHGEILSVRLDRDYVSREPTGVGYVCMASVEAAQNALKNLAGVYVEGKPLVVQLFKPKEDRQREVMQRKQRFGQADMFDMNRAPFMAMQRNNYNMPLYTSNLHPQQQMMQAYMQQQQMMQQQQAQQQQVAQQQQQMMMQQRQQQMMMQQQQQAQMQAQQQAQQQQHGRQPTIEDLVNMDPVARRTFFGERLFPLVSNVIPVNEASKVTGMLLEMDPTELMHLMEDGNALQEKVHEAMAVLQEHARQEQAQQQQQEQEA